MISQRKIKLYSYDKCECGSCSRITNTILLQVLFGKTTSNYDSETICIKCAKALIDEVVVFEDES